MGSVPVVSGVGEAPMKRWGRVLDFLFGPKCPLGCGQRVYEKPQDRSEHWGREHGGDAWPTTW